MGNDLRTRLRGAIARADKNGNVEIPTSYLEEALAAMSPEHGEPTSFGWSEEMYAAFTCILDVRRPYPHMGELMAIWNAMHDAAGYD